MKFIAQNSKYQPSIDILIDYRDNKQIQEMLETALQLHEDASKDGDIQVINYANYLAAEAYYYLNDLDHCYAKCWELIEFYDHNIKDIIYVITCNLFASLYQGKSDLHNAIMYFFKAYQQAKIEQFKEFELKILNNIGTLFFDIDCYDEALYYFLLVFEAIDNIEEYSEIYEVTLVNILISYTRKKDLKSAMEWENKYQHVLKHPKNIFGKLGYMSYRVIYDAYRKDLDSMRNNLHLLLEESKKTWAGHVSSTLILDAVDACISVQAYEEANEGFSLVKGKLEDDYKLKLKMTDLYVKMYKETKNKKMLIQCLQVYYEYHQKLSEKDSEIEFKNLKNIVQLEEERYLKKQLLKRQKELYTRNALDEFLNLLHKKSYIEHVNAYFMNKEMYQIGAFVIIDVDNFKYVNDTYGHMIGDKVLKDLSSIFKRNIRKDDIIGRIGGDEFSFVLRDMKDKDCLGKKLQRILEQVNLIKVDGLDEEISVSIGGVITDQNVEYEALLKVADKALYDAKAKGKNTYAIIDKT